jgi:hypothetical protein
VSGNVPNPSEKDPYKIVRAIRELFEGRSNAVGTFTLSASTTTTTVTSINCGSACTVVAEPMTANAAAEKGNGTMYISSVLNGSFVVTHANAVSTDRTFRYVALG